MIGIGVDVWSAGGWEHPVLALALLHAMTSLPGWDSARVILIIFSLGLLISARGIQVLIQKWPQWRILILAVVVLSSALTVYTSFQKLNRVIDSGPQERAAEVLAAEIGSKWVVLDDDFVGLKIMQFEMSRHGIRVVNPYFSVEEKGDYSCGQVFLSSKQRSGAVSVKFTNQAGWKAELGQEKKFNDVYLYEITRMYRESL